MVRVASRHLKGLDLLINYNYYDDSLDICSIKKCSHRLYMMKNIDIYARTIFIGDSNEYQLFKTKKRWGRKIYLNISKVSFKTGLIISKITRQINIYLF